MPRRTTSAQRTRTPAKHTPTKQPPTKKGNNQMNNQTLPACWQALNDLTSAQVDRVLLYGPPGTGKTFYGLTSKPASQPAYRLICTDEMSTAEITGLWQPTGDRFTYKEGLAVTAWRTGARLVIDEINRANGDVMSLLLAFTDTVASSSWENPETGETVTPSPGYSVVLTMNGEPDDLEPALLDRFTARVHITEPHPEAVAQLPDYLRNMASALGQLEGQERASIRAFQTVEQVAKTHGIQRALELVLPNQARDILNAIEVQNLEMPTI
jgi:MoxR-like ATPase